MASTTGVALLNATQHQGTVVSQTPNLSGAVQFTSPDGISLLVVPPTEGRSDFVRGVLPQALDSQFWLGRDAEYCGWTPVRAKQTEAGTQVTLMADKKNPLIVCINKDGTLDLFYADEEDAVSFTKDLSPDTSGAISANFHAPNYIRKPGHFLAERFGEFNQYVPEDTSTEIREFARSAGEQMRKFLDERVDVPGYEGKMARREAIELNVEKDFRHARAVIEAMGSTDWGLLALNFPEEFGGFPVPLTDKAAISQAVAANATSSASIGAGGHTGIALSPILNFGSPDQKAKYLTDMCRGKRIGAFALTEPGAGTDIAAMASTAELVEKPDRSKVWRINGTKQFITNASMSADSEKPGQFILFAKVNGAITAFIVDGDTPGISVKEEHKMGLKGSSTGEVRFENVEIPEDALLGKVGEGKKIALQTLGKGRWSICMGNAGVMAAVVKDAVAYSKERQSMGHSISCYGTIEELFAEANFALFILESLGFGVAGLFEGLLQTSGQKGEAGEAKVWRELPLESSACKVIGSEEAFFKMVGALQIWGGYGYIEEYPMARRVRDHLVDMIFEGANPIQMVGVFGKEFLERSFAGIIPKPEATDATWKARLKHLDLEFGDEHPLYDTMRLAEAGKETVNLLAAALMTAPNVVALLTTERNSHGQHLLIELSRLAMSTFVSHYVTARALKLVDRYGEEAAQVPIMMAMACVYEMDEKVRQAARRLVNDLYEDREEGRQAALRHLDTLDLRPAINLKGLQARIAQTIIERGKYHLGVTPPLV